MIWEFRVHSDAIRIGECPLVFLDLMHRVFLPNIERFVVVFVQTIPFFFRKKVCY